MTKIDIMKKKEKLIDSYVKEYYEDIPDPNTETIKYHKTRLRWYSKHIGNKAFKDVSSEDTKSFLKKYSQDSYEPLRSCITNFYRWHLKLEYDDKLPEYLRVLKSRSGRALRKQGKEIKIRPRLISPEEYKLLIDNAINPYQKAIIETLYLTGARISEILSMKATDIIQGDKITKIIVRESKTEPREIPIMETPQYLLEWYRTFQPYKGDDKKPLWASPYGKSTFQTIKREAVLKMIQKTSKKAGITKKITNHDFRHTAISRDLANGMPRSLVESKFGLVHGSEMLRIYDHNGNVQLEEYYNKNMIDKPETPYALERKYKQESTENTIKIMNLENDLIKTNKLLDEMKLESDSNQLLFYHLLYCMRNPTSSKLGQSVEERDEKIINTFRTLKDEKNNLIFDEKTIQSFKSKRDEMYSQLANQDKEMDKQHQLEKEKIQHMKKQHTQQVKNLTDEDIQSIIDERTQQFRDNQIQHFKEERKKPIDLKPKKHSRDKDPQGNA